MKFTPVVMEVRRVKIRSIFRLAFLFHLLIGLIVGLLLVGIWKVIALFGMNEILPTSVRDLAEPTTSRILVLLSLSALAMGFLGAVVWSFLILLYNVIAGFVRGIELETVTGGKENEGDSNVGG